MALGLALLVAGCGSDGNEPQPDQGADSSRVDGTETDSHLEKKLELQVALTARSTGTKGKAMSIELARRMLEQAGAGGDTPAHLQAVEDLSRALQRARAEWTTVAIDEERWCDYLARRLAAEKDPLSAVTALHVEDLYLCCGCLHGDPAALQSFHASCVPVVQRTLRRIRLGDAVEQELQQQLVVRLLVGDKERAPLLTKYEGIGRLVTWLRVVVAREGRKALEREKRLVPSSDDRIEKELVWDGVELPFTKESYRRAFKAAFKAALAELDPKEANLLRYRYVDGLNLEQIGAIYRVHASTAHRWIDRVRERLLDLTHRNLAHNLDIPKSECATIIRLIRSDFDLTLHSFFGQNRPQEEQ